MEPAPSRTDNKNASTVATATNATTDERFFCFTMATCECHVTKQERFVSLTFGVDAFNGQSN